ncbi:hypothetical protein DUI87_18905 [Hirundo rustica rustica]|uniref:Fibronectin type-III domain-containing protein n=1 Tax=Hirundo rustica rustica TaxID=333673 RepID=A0A3M0JW94_HIRRU|nr:hypothetical protein DUI87_18905 [Hirundo rustica rustica]
MKGPVAFSWLSPPVFRDCSPFENQELTEKMKNSLLAAILLLVRDWDNELVCYKELSEDLTCTWLPVPSAESTVNYTVYLKWNKIRKLFQRNTSSPSITIERKNLYIERLVSIWIAVNYAHDTCAKGKNISVLPSKAGKCLSPSNMNAHQIRNQLIMKWDLPTAHTAYELRYREALTESAPWTLVPLGSNAVNVTISNLNAMSSYIVQLRCVTEDGLNCVCIWSKEILVPHKLMNKPRISYNVTTQVSPGRRSVLLKWEVAQSENVLGYFVNVERIPNSCSHPPNHISLKDREILVNISMAYYRVNISAYNEAGESPQATYIVPEFSVTDLPGQIHVKSQGTNAVVTWTPEYNPKCFVVDWGTGKEDMQMKIITTATRNFTLDNFQPYKLYKIMVHASDVCQCESFIRHEKTFGVTHFYSVEGEALPPFPIGSALAEGTSILGLAGIGSVGLGKLLELLTEATQTNWKPVSRSLLQALSDNDTTSLFIIERESKAPLTLDLFTDGGEDSKHDTCQSEKHSNNLHVSPRHEETPAEAVTSEEDTVSIEAPLLSDYASMEFSQKALTSLAASTPERTAHPHLEMEQSSKPAQTKHKVLSFSQDYLKQSQVVLLPSGPNFTGQAN